MAVSCTGYYEIDSGSSNITSPNSYLLHTTTDLSNSANGTIVLNEIDMLFQDRSTAAVSLGSNTFKGLDIDITDSGITKLAPNEIAIGVNVDLSSLINESTNFTPNSPIFRGTKYAALFNGGSVGIEHTAPDATLHLDITQNVRAFRVEAKDSQGNNAIGLTTSYNLVGMGTVTVDAKLHIQQSANTSTADMFKVSGSLGTTISSLTSDGSFGLTSRTPQSKLDIDNTLTATGFYAQSLISPTLIVATSNFVVASNGNIGIGTSEPNGPVVHNVQPLNDDTITKRSKQISLGLGNADIHLTGLQINVSSNATNFLGSNNGETFTATGLSIDTTGLTTASDNNTIIGFELSVTPNSASADTYAALFNGGNVGVWSNQPKRRPSSHWETANKWRHFPNIVNRS